jgi:hypothetical protein
MWKKCLVNGMKCIITKHDNKNFYPGWIWMGKEGKYMSKVIDGWMDGIQIWRKTQNKVADELACEVEPLFNQGLLLV